MRRTAVIWALGRHRREEFGGDDDIFALSEIHDGIAEHHLTRALRVDVSGVKEVDALQTTKTTQKEEQQPHEKTIRVSLLSYGGTQANNRVLLSEGWLAGRRGCNTGGWNEGDGTTKVDGFRTTPVKLTSVRRELSVKVGSAL